MLKGSYRQYYDVQTVTREGLLFEKIFRSDWWKKATHCVDSHYSNVDGVMLSHHLIAVTVNIDHIFNRHRSIFLTRLFAILPLLNVNPERLREELRIVSLLHDIGKIEHDKSKTILHPINKRHTIKRHSIVSLYAALDILQEEPLLNDEEKARIYAVIEEHDVSYGLYREWMCTGKVPRYERWKELNDKIDPTPGAGLMYLLFFKLADTHGHWNINDVIWFFQQVKLKYFNRLGIVLPMPKETDIR